MQNRTSEINVKTHTKSTKIGNYVKTHTTRTPENSIPHVKNQNNKKLRKNTLKFNHQKTM